MKMSDVQYMISITWSYDNQAMEHTNMLPQCNKQPLLSKDKSHAPHLARISKYANPMFKKLVKSSNKRKTLML